MPSAVSAKPPTSPFAIAPDQPRKLLGRPIKPLLNRAEATTYRVP
jgi:hypothetical protein